MVAFMQRGTMHARLMVQTAVMQGTSGAEGEWKALTQGTFATDLLTARKAYAMSLLAEELVRFSNPAAIGLVNASLRDAVTAATDVDFLAQIVADATPVASNGGGLSAVLMDAQAAMDAVATGSASKLFWVMSSDNSKALTMMPTASGARAYPEMSPTGGSFYGIPALVSDEIGTNVVLADAC